MSDLRVQQPKTEIAKRASSKAPPITPAHIGWATFSGNGGEIIREVDTTKVSKTVGPTAKTPVIRLRAASKLPKIVAKVRKRHVLLFTDYKKVGRQVRSLVAMGTKFVIKSGRYAVVVDRSPAFEHDLIDQELSLRRAEIVTEVVIGLLPAVQKLNGKLKADRQKALNAERTQDTELENDLAKPLASFKRSIEACKGQLPEDTYKACLEFLDNRQMAGATAKIRTKTEENLNRS